MHLLHHINFEVTASVDLAEIAGEDLIAAQLRVVRNIKLLFSPLNNFLFGGVLSQNSWVSWFCKTSASDQNVINIQRQS